MGHTEDNVTEPDFELSTGTETELTNLSEKLTQLFTLYII
jgi:hypothetical protein